jgi:hypothetical protein
MPLSVFPVNDTDAANAWLADESNHNFKEWEGTSLEDQKKWILKCSVFCSRYLVIFSGFSSNSIANE